MDRPPTAQARALFKARQPQQAIDVLRQAAAEGDAEALFMLAELTWRGGPVQQDSGRGRELFARAAAAGHLVAGFITTNLLASGIAGPRNWKEALSRLALEAPHNPLRRGAHDLLSTMKIDDEGDPESTPEPAILAQRPYVRLFRGLVSRAECDHLVALASSSFRPSTVYDEDGRMVRDPIRTSDASPIHWAIEDPAAHAINRRIGSVTGTAYDQGETLQTLRYSPGQEYRPHFDFVAEDNRRLWTALLYLNDDYEGGETEFVRTGLKVRESAGDVLVFANAGPDGESEALAEHAGLPVTSGTKFLATRWIRERKFIP